MPTPIYMLNVLWFNPKGGQQTYRQYLKAAEPVFKKHGGRKLDSYTPDKALIGNFDADLIFFVEWPSWDNFQQFINDPDFLAIRHLREQSLEKSLLIRCNKI